MPKRQSRIQAATAAVLATLLSHHGRGLFAADVARASDLEINVVSPILKRLHLDGWVEESDDPHDMWDGPNGRQSRKRYRLEPTRGRLWAEQRLELASVTGVKYRRPRIGVPNAVS